MPIGSRIKELRLKARLSQSELGNKVDTDSTIISRWETNRVRPGQKYIVRLAQALNTSTDYLLGKMDDPNPTVENATTGDTVSNEEDRPYTQEQINKGMLVYTLSNGERIELPPIQASYDFLREMASRAAHVAVL